ncbi:hypothetical protein ONZ45_g4079 [Pleurotus djamor]|nr:hypothetical protein ONZ45_g4079 [Pleurotus djamor]
MSTSSPTQVPGSSTTSAAGVDEMLSVNWYLIQRPITYATTELRRSELETMNLPQLRSHFGEEILSGFDYVPAINATLKFYSLKDKISLAQTRLPDWADDDAVHMAIHAEEGQVAINWFFHSHRSITPFTKRILFSQYDDDSGLNRLKQYFIDHVTTNYHFTPELIHLSAEIIDGDIPIQFSGLTNEWAAGLQTRPFTHITQIATPLRDPSIFHLLVKVKGDDEARDTVPEIQRYERLVKAKLDPPSKESKPSKFISHQMKETRIYDGRFAQDSPGVSTIAPPIEIYSQVFGKFLSLLQDDSHQPSPVDIACVKELSTLLSAITTAHETSRNNDVREALTAFFGQSLKLLSKANKDGTLPDGVIFITVGDIKIPILILELKNELGKGDCDPTTQASLSMRSAWLDPTRKHIRDRCNCPTFLLAGGGAWLNIMGAVLTDKIIVQRLTDMTWLARSSTEEARRIYMAARSLTALRSSLQLLESYYTTEVSLVETTILHQRFFPYPTSYRPNGQQEVAFEYVRPLQQTDICMTFLAKTTSEPKTHIVVKFVTAYGEAVHRFLAERQHAPELRYFGPLPHGLIPPPAASRHAPPGLFLQPFQMVVMDYVDALPKSARPDDATKQVADVLKLLTDHGFVFGDLRRNNVLFTLEHDQEEEKKKVQFIDFDWAGYEEGGTNKPENYSGPYAYYPYDINMDPEIHWHPDVKPLTPIRAEHDTHMLEKLFAQ